MSPEPRRLLWRRRPEARSRGCSKAAAGLSGTPVGATISAAVGTPVGPTIGTPVSAAVGPTVVDAGRTGRSTVRRTLRTAIGAAVGTTVVDARRTGRSTVRRTLLLIRMLGIGHSSS
ncbi:hypothetical protein AB0M87_09090 [Streptomyces sp. NPDC051320]|uniref:hypothetical protein n=1 Tax=Streptomyces sp. NPDC051320 TaxID=3154644 RepID=UPI003419112B